MELGPTNQKLDPILVLTEDKGRITIDSETGIFWFIKLKHQFIYAA